MKIRAYKKEVEAAGRWYINQLYQKFLYTVMSPANVELARRYLYALQCRQIASEKNLVWTIPVDVEVIDQAQGKLSVTFDESNVLYLDFDK